MKVDLNKVKKLRAKTDVGIGACKKALIETNGNIEEAEKLLRKQGVAKALKRAEKVAGEGAIGVYLHSNNKVAAILELNCETDFCAKSDVFLQVAHDLAMQVAAMNPMYKDSDSVPEGVLEDERKLYIEELKKEGKPENIIEKIVEGKLSKFFEEYCLLQQRFIKDDSKTVKDYLDELVAKIGEKIGIGEFYRIKIGN